MEFPCTKCGQCCRNLDRTLKSDYNNVILNELRDSFPYKPSEDGSCEMLTEDGLCSVYETRPNFCNITKAGLLLGITDLNLLYSTFADSCNKLIRESGLNESYIVKF